MVRSSRGVRHRPATLLRRSERNGADGPHDARPSLADHCRARPHGLAEGLRLSLKALVEADISRFKRAIGDGLRSRIDRRRSTEVAIAVDALTRMLELGRPEYVRLP